MLADVHASLLHFDAPERWTSAGGNQYDSHPRTNIKCRLIPTTVFFDKRRWSA